MVDLLTMLRSAIWGKEGVQDDRERWIDSLNHVPDPTAEIAEPGRMTSGERVLVSQILKSFLPKQPRETS